MPEITVNGTSLTYVEKGEGEPVVLVHGSLGDYRSWPAQQEVFARHFRVIAYSRRYHYPNPWTGAGPDYSAELHAAELAALIQALDIAPAHLVGQSFGAYTSLTCAVRYPEVVRSLVLGEPPILPWLEHLPGGPSLSASFLETAWNAASEAFRMGDREAGVRSFINGVSGANVFDTLPPQRRAAMMENAPELEAETVSTEYFQAVPLEEACRVSVPVLILSGERSPRMFHVITEALAACLPNATSATIPGASHGMPSGNPQAYNAAVLAFLERQHA